METINNLLIEKTIEAVMFNSDGSVRWSAQDVAEPKINVTTEAKEKLDAMQNVISKLFTGKKAEVTFTTNIFSLGIAAAQAGADVESASDTNKMVTSRRDEIVVGATDGTVNTTITLTQTPIGTEGSAVKYIYVQNADRSLGRRFEVGVDADDKTFTQSGATITLPVGADIKATDTIVVYYDYEAVSGTGFTSTTEVKSDNGILKLYVRFKDVCNEEMKYSGVIEFPAAQLSPDCEIGLAYDSTYPITVFANKKYCSSVDKLFSVFIPVD